MASTEATPDSERHDYDQLLIIEKYETFLNYIYPIANNIPRQHGIAKTQFIEALVNQPSLFIEAGKTGQISRLYIADAGIANIRYWLRFWSDGRRASLNHHQHLTASIQLAEVGKILGAWISHKRGKPSGHKVGTL